MYFLVYAGNMRVDNINIFNLEKNKMRTIDITIPMIVVTVFSLLLIGNTEINSKFPFIHFGRPLALIGAITFAIAFSCFYYQGKIDAKKEYLEKVESLEKPKSDHIDLKE